MVELKLAETLFDRQIKFITACEQLNEIVTTEISLSFWKSLLQKEKLVNLGQLTFEDPLMVYWLKDVLKLYRFSGLLKRDILSYSAKRLFNLFIENNGSCHANVEISCVFNQICYKTANLTSLKQPEFIQRQVFSDMERRDVIEKTSFTAANRKVWRLETSFNSQKINLKEYRSQFSEFHLEPIPGNSAANEHQGGYLLAYDPAELKQALDIENNFLAKNISYISYAQKIGQKLGYPHCCISEFVEHKRRLQKSGRMKADQKGYRIRKTQKMICPLTHTCGYTACSFECKATISNLQSILTTYFKRENSSSLRGTPPLESFFYYLNAKVIFISFIKRITFYGVFSENRLLFQYADSRGFTQEEVDILKNISSVEFTDRELLLLDDQGLKMKFKRNEIYFMNPGEIKLAALNKIRKNPVIQESFSEKKSEF